MRDNTNQLISLPETGLLQFDQFKHLVRMTRATWLKLVAQGKAPKAHRLNDRLTFYKAEDLNRFLADPSGFQA